MAWTYEQKFNTLNNGDLHGQDSWNQAVGAVKFQVQESVKYEGAKGVSITNPSNDSQVSRFIDSINAGLVYIAHRKTVANIVSYLILGETATGDKCYIRFHSDGNIYQGYGNGAGGILWAAIQAYNADQWYVVAIEFDDVAQSNKFRVKIHNGVEWGSWTDWRLVYLDSYTNIQYISFYELPGVHVAYHDTITPTDPTTPPTVALVNIGDTFKNVTAIKLNLGGVWKTVTKAQINISDVWKSIF